MSPRAVPGGSLQSRPTALLGPTRNGPRWRKRRVWAFMARDAACTSSPPPRVQSSMTGMPSRARAIGRAAGVPLRRSRIRGRPSDPSRLGPGVHSRLHRVPSQRSAALCHAPSRTSGSSGAGSPFRASFARTTEGVSDASIRRRRDIRKRARAGGCAPRGRPPAGCRPPRPHGLVGGFVQSRGNARLVPSYLPTVADWLDRRGRGVKSEAAPRHRPTALTSPRCPPDACDGGGRRP